MDSPQVLVTADHTLAFVMAGDACFEQGHRLEHGVSPDRICCADCQYVAAEAIRDGVDPADALDLFRSGEWTREEPS